MLKQEQQFVQCFQLSIDDLNTMITEAVKSVIPPPPTINSNSILSGEESDPNSDLLTPKEVQEILKISSTTLWRYTRTGLLKIKSKIGRRVYYSKKDLSNLINNAA